MVVVGQRPIVHIDTDIEHGKLGLVGGACIRDDVTYGCGDIPAIGLFEILYCWGVTLVTLGGVRDLTIACGELQGNCIDGRETRDIHLRCEERTTTLDTIIDTGTGIMDWEHL